MRLVAIVALAVAALFTVLAIAWVVAGPSQPVQPQVGIRGAVRGMSMST